MTRNSDLDLEDLASCDHSPETPVRDSAGFVGGWICRCGRNVSAPSQTRKEGQVSVEREDGFLIWKNEAGHTECRIHQLRNQSIVFMIWGNVGLGRTGWKGSVHADPVIHSEWLNGLRDFLNQKSLTCVCGALKAAHDPENTSRCPPPMSEKQEVPL